MYIFLVKTLRPSMELVHKKNISELPAENPKNLKPAVVVPQKSSSNKPENTDFFDSETARKNTSDISENRKLANVTEQNSQSESKSKNPQSESGAMEGNTESHARTEGEGAKGPAGKSGQPASDEKDQAGSNTFFKTGTAEEKDTGWFFCQVI